MTRWATGQPLHTSAREYDMFRVGLLVGCGHFPAQQRFLAHTSDERQITCAAPSPRLGLPPTTTDDPIGIRVEAQNLLRCAATVGKKKDVLEKKQGTTTEKPGLKATVGGVLTATPTTTDDDRDCAASICRRRTAQEEEAQPRRSPLGGWGTARSAQCGRVDARVSHMIPSCTPCIRVRSCSRSSHWGLSISGTDLSRTG